MYIFPDASTATPTGKYRPADVASPPSPVYPLVPSPATVVMIPSPDSGVMDDQVNAINTHSFVAMESTSSSFGLSDYVSHHIATDSTALIDTSIWASHTIRWCLEITFKLWTP